MSFTVHTMNYVVADGKSNWMEGLILVCKSVYDVKLDYFTNISRLVFYHRHFVLVLPWLQHVIRTSYMHSQSITSFSLTPIRYILPTHGLF